MAMEIRCSDLGNDDCRWRAVANTEDRLVDYMAVHARDYHGIDQFTQEMIAQARSNITEESSYPDAPEMMEYSCPVCSWRYIAQTKDLIVDAAALHARDEHDVSVFTADMAVEVKDGLKKWGG